MMEFLQEINLCGAELSIYEERGKDEGFVSLKIRLPHENSTSFAPYFDRIGHHFHINKLSMKEQKRYF